MTISEDLAVRSIEVLEKLVAFDTTSRGSNLALIEYAEGVFADLGVASRRVPNADGTKSNLMATIGPNIEGGVVLSGHTDVVPVDGQPWTTDPWVLTRKDGRLYGRGTCDMKSFLAIALAAAPQFAKADLKRPVHYAFSYDEEVGCLGAPDMIDEIVKSVPRPAAVLVGEPTDMQAISGLKGISTWKVTVTGKEAHSSMPYLGASANMAAIRLLTYLVKMAEDLEARADPASPFLPKGATITVGMINGGTATNILARECIFFFDLRCPPGQDPREAVKPFLAEAAAVDAELKVRFEDCGVLVENRSLTPAFAPEKDGYAEGLARRLAGDNGPMRVASYGAEAGQFQQAGFSTILCGPGSIDQAHQPNEFIEISQIERGAAFMSRLIETLSAD